jgi:FkbM family methyltransferase
VFKYLTGRKSSSIVNIAMEKTQRKTLTVPEAYSNPMGSLFYYHAFGMNPVELIEEFAQSDLQPDPEVATNFIGLKTPIDVYPPILETKRGTVEAPPLPGNWHADIAEWASAFHAVKKSGETFRIVELGCGWGCWLANTGIVARRLNKSVKLLGVEGDANHLINARKTLELNGFTDDDFKLFNGVAGKGRGKAIFPNFAAGEAAWGGQAIFSPSTEELQQAQVDPSKQILDCYTLDSVSDGGIIDLLHIDIQGAEVDFVEGNFREIESLVRRVLIGTHSRTIEGRLIEMFLGAGWKMEMDRPALTPIIDGVPRVAIDGVHLWANPRLI